MSLENTGRGEFTEFVTNHVLGNENRDEGFTVMNQEVQADEVRRDHGITAPGFDRLAVFGINSCIDFREQLLINEWAFLKGTWHNKKWAKARGAKLNCANRTFLKAWLRKRRLQAAFDTETYAKSNGADATFAKAAVAKAEFAEAQIAESTCAEA